MLAHPTAIAFKADYQEVRNSLRLSFQSDGGAWLEGQRRHGYKTHKEAEPFLKLVRLNYLMTKYLLIILIILATP